MVGKGGGHARGSEGVEDIVSFYICIILHLLLFIGSDI